MLVLNFVLPGATVIDLTVILRQVFVFLDQRSELFCSFIKVSSDIKHLHPSKERVRTCKDNVIGREITAVPKIAVNYVTRVTALLDFYYADANSPLEIRTSLFVCFFFPLHGSRKL